MVVSSVDHNGLGNFLINILEKFSKNWIKYFLNTFLRPCLWKDGTDVIFQIFPTKYN